jgi:hypothetical protein
LQDKEHYGKRMRKKLADITRVGKIHKPLGYFYEGETRITGIVSSDLK